MNRSSGGRGQAPHFRPTQGSSRHARTFRKKNNTARSILTSALAGRSLRAVESWLGHQGSLAAGKGLCP